MAVRDNRCLLGLHQDDVLMVGSLFAEEVEREMDGNHLHWVSWKSTPDLDSPGSKKHGCSCRRLHWEEEETCQDDALVFLCILRT